jgi:integrase/recombinase XerD
LGRNELGALTILLAPHTGRALDLYIGERTMGPIFLGVEDSRMDCYCADQMVKRQAKRAGIDKRIPPHSLRHSFITAALDAGIPRRDVQDWIARNAGSRLVERASRTVISERVRRSHRPETSAHIESAAIAIISSMSSVE